MTPDTMVEEEQAVESGSSTVLNKLISAANEKALVKGSDTPVTPTQGDCHKNLYGLNKDDISDVRKEFGQWSDGIVAAGLKPNAGAPRGKRRMTAKKMKKSKDILLNSKATMTTKSHNIERDILRKLNQAMEVLEEGRTVEHEAMFIAVKSLREEFLIGFAQRELS